MPLELSRRSLLQSVALCGVSACSFDRGTTGSDRVGEATKAQQAATEAVDRTASLMRRLERATFGVTSPLREQVDSPAAFERWLDSQLDGERGFTDADTLAYSDAVEALLGDHDFADLVPGDAGSAELADMRRRSVQTLVGRTVVGAAFGEDQLRQRVVDVLADLLHVSSSQSPEIFLVPDYDEVLREGAFGRFADLLATTARHPAMLVFLDQATSRADGGRTPNENYAREVMELHTVGVDGGYDEQDVVELAHVLTGWSIDRVTRSFTFRAGWHDLGSFATGGDILGWRPDATQTGEQAGAAAIEHLAKHPATARKIAHRFARHFVSESIAVDDDLVVEAAQVYTENDTALGPVVRHLLTSERFDGTATLMLRRPIDLLAHVLRVTGARLDPAEPERTTRGMAGLLHVMGQLPYAWPAPNGYPFGSAAWSNPGAIISRWNAMITLAGSEIALSPDAIGAAGSEELVTLLCGPAHQLH